MATTTFTDNVEILGSRDIEQLVVRADDAQTEPLQEWQDNNGETLARVAALGTVEILGGEERKQLVVRAADGQENGEDDPLQEWQDATGGALAQITPAGQMRLGTDLATSSPSALLEVAEELAPSTEVKQGFQASGVLDAGGTHISDPLSWVVQEMTLEGTNGVEGLQTTLRTRLNQRNTGGGGDAELRAGDFQVTNEGGAEGNPIEHAAALHGAVDNLEGGYLGKGVAVEAALHNADGADADVLSAFEVALVENEGAGTIQHLRGLYIPDINVGETSNYAIYTNEGKVHLGDVLEMQLPADTPTTPSEDTIIIYPKVDGENLKLFARDSEDNEYDLTSGSSGGSGSGLITVVGTGGEALAQRDHVYFKASDSKWYKVDADDTTPKLSSIRGVVSQSGGISSSATGEITLQGVVGGFSGLTVGALVYASGTAGGYTQTKPSVSAGSGQLAQVVIGEAISTTAVWVRREKVRYLKRENLSNNSTLTLTHHADANANSRILTAFGSSDDSGASLVSYASSNKDSDVGLLKIPYTSDLCSGGTASASNEYSGLYASYAFDDSAATDWAAYPLSYPEWIKYDFGSGNSKMITQVKVKARLSYPDQSPSAFTIQGSTDNSNWNTVHTVTGATGWGAGQTRTYQFTNTTAYRYWRLNITANDGSTALGISEIEMMESSTDGLAQSFQLTGTQNVYSAKLWLRKVGNPTGTLTLRVETNNGGSPSGTLVDSNSSVAVSESSLSTSYGWIVFDFITNFSLSGSTTYWLVLSSNRTVNGTDYVDWGADGSSPGYASGEMKSRASAVWIAENKDACFDIFGLGTIYEEQMACGRWSGGTRDVAIRYDDGSGSNPETKTTFKNVSGATLDVTCVVELP